MLRKSLVTSMIVALILLGMSFAIAQTPSVTAASNTIVDHSTPPTDMTSTYIDRKLGFGLHLSTGWVAYPRPGRLNNGNADVYFTNSSFPSAYLEIGVMRSPSASADFAARGPAPLHVGIYPAFQLDTRASAQMPLPCLGRVMLAVHDIVIASWCSPDASTHRQQFEAILASYQVHGARSIQSGATPQTPVNPVLTCGQVMQNPGPNMWGTLPPSGDATFGAEQVYPTDSTWTNSFGEGVAVCDDYYTGGGYMWESSYLFQCVELANRFINEEWGLKEFTVDAFAYYDSYQSGGFVEGQARSYFGSQVQQVDDASQGSNSAPPSPGDLLIFQDVNDHTNWTSGEICWSNNNPCSNWDPGHVAVVTSVTSSQVNLVQQNFNANGATWTLQLQKWSNGYHIVDNSGVTGRITRGWIHFNESGLASGVNTQDVYALGANQSLYDYHWSLQNGWSIDSSMNSLTPQGVSLTGTPGSNTFTISGSVYGHVVAVSNTGQLYEYWRRIGGGWGFNNLSSIVPPPSGVSFVGSPSVYSYTVPGQSTTRHSIYVLGSDSNLYYYAWTQGSGNGTWTLTNITQQRPLPSGVTPTGIPAGNAFPIGSGEDQHVVVVGSNGHLYEFWQSIGGNWYLNDLSTLAAPPSGVSFVGSPSVYSYTVPGQTGTNHSIYVLGSDNNLYYYGWKGSSNTWTLSNLTQLRPLPSGVTPTGTPAGDAFPIGSGEDQHTLVVGSDGHLYEFWQSIGGNWYLNDLSTLTSSTVAVTGSPTSYSYVLQGQTAERHSIQVVTSDGHLREYVWVQGSGSGTWSVLDHGIPSGTTLAGSSPNGEVYSS